MAVRPGWVVGVARVSAAAWQRVACNPETLPPDRVLALLCCAPLHLLAHLAAFLCIPFLPRARAPIHLLASPRRRFLVLVPPDPAAYSSDSLSSSSDEDEDEDDDGDDIQEEGLRVHRHTD